MTTDNVTDLGDWESLGGLAGNVLERARNAMMHRAVCDFASMHRRPEQLQLFDDLEPDKKLEQPGPSPLTVITPEDLK